MDFRTTVTKGESETLRVTIADTATLSNAAVFSREFRYFKIAPVSITGIPAAVDINFLVGGRTLLIDGIEADMTHPNAVFVWTLDVKAYVNNITLSLGVATTDDVEFQITGYA